ncbi:MAG: bleomycin resistance protein [Alphaproteobacteria bacterium]
MKSKNAAPRLVPELGCTDFEASRKFYVDVLGFEVVYARPQEGFAYLRRQGVDLMIDDIALGRTWKTAPLEAPLGRGMNLQIEICDVDALYARVGNVCGEVFLPIEEKWYRAGDVEVGNRQFIVADPDGYLLRFFQSLGERVSMA